MKKIVVLLSLFFVATLLHAQSGLWLGEANQEYTNVTLTTTNTTGMTQLLPAARDAVTVAQVVVCNATNSSTVAMIVYGTNSVVGGGIQLTPGACVALVSPPHANGPVYGYLTTSGTATVALVRQPQANQP